MNAISTDKQLEGIATVLYLVQSDIPKTREELIKGFQNWSDDKAARFSVNDIEMCIDYLENTALISRNLYGKYEMTRDML